MTVRVDDIAFVRFEAPDLDLMESFLLSFGLVRSARDEHTLYMRGTDDEGFVHVTHLGPSARFIGLAFAVSNPADLDELAACEGFSAVGDLAGPGGGRAVHAVDPNGFQVEVVAARQSVGRLPNPTSALRNSAEATARVGAPVRLADGPSHVKRLGHCVLDVLDFRESEAWYKQHFGLVTSDEVLLDEHTPLGAFLRCDRGASHVDHHTLFLVGVGRAKFNHAAFEVADFDDLMRGHSHLAAARHTHQWGIGRHILGSQIYDYWLDPYGHMVEHWTDGDLFNDQTPPATASLEVLLGSQWGPTSGHPPA